jgi:hypothetical protein
MIVNSSTARVEKLLAEKRARMAHAREALAAKRKATLSVKVATAPVSGNSQVEPEVEKPRGKAPKGTHTSELKLPEPQPERSSVQPEEPEGDLFEDAPDLPDEIEVPESPFPAPAPREEVLPMRPDDGLPPADTGLTEDEKKKFIELINKEINVGERAVLLGALARLHGAKTAAVGLRAIQEINHLTGMSTTRATDTAPLFVLPEGTKVAVLVGKVDK